MVNEFDKTKLYTPEQVGQMLQLSNNTIYNLINNGEIIAKKIGKVYRIPATSLSFVFTSLDYDLYAGEIEDKKNIKEVEETIKNVRKEI